MWIIQKRYLMIWCKPYVHHIWIIWFVTYDSYTMPFLWSNMKQYDRYIIHRCGAYVAKLPVYIKDIQYDFLLIIASNKQSIGEHQNRKVSLNNYLLNLFLQAFQNKTKKCFKMWNKATCCEHEQEYHWLNYNKMA